MSQKARTFPVLRFFIFPPDMKAGRKLSGSSSSANAFSRSSGIVFPISFELVRPRASDASEDKPFRHILPAHFSG
jgi:hypothetical protein